MSERSSSDQLPKTDRSSKARAVMAKDTYSLRDIAGRGAQMLEIRCGRCERHGRLSVRRRLAEHGLGERTCLPVPGWPRPGSKPWSATCRLVSTYCAGKRAPRATGLSNGSPRTGRREKSASICTGEILLPLRIACDLAGIGGLTVDPDTVDGLRVRRFYIRPTFRRRAMPIPWVY
jgi:hypothetical protein